MGRVIIEMNAYQIALWILCSFYIRESTCIIDPLSISATIAAGSGILFGYQYAVCKFYECCDDAYIPQNINGRYTNHSPFIYDQKQINCLLIRENKINL